MPICCFNKHFYVSWLKHTRSMVEQKISSFISIFKITHLLLCTFSIEVGHYTYIYAFYWELLYIVYIFMLSCHCLLSFYVIFCIFYHYSVFTIFMLCVQMKPVRAYNDKKELVSGYVWPLINCVFSNLATMRWRELFKDGLKQTCRAEQWQPSE